MKISRNTETKDLQAVKSGHLFETGIAFANLLENLESISRVF